MSTINVNTLRTAAGASPVLVAEIAKATDVSAVRADLAAPTGSSLVGYMPAGVGAVATDVESKLNITSRSVNDFYLPGDGADWYPAFRRAVATGKRVNVYELPAGQYYGVSQSIIKTTDAVVDLFGVGMPEIRLTSTLSTSSEDINSVIRTGSVATRVNVENFILRGNWVAETNGASGIGLNISPTANCVPYVNNVKAYSFCDYGVNFYVYRANVGRVEGHNCRYQGVAVTNVRDSLSIDYIYATGNGVAGFDMEWSQGSGAGRLEGLKNVTIGTVEARNNGEYGLAITTGGGTDVSMAARSLTIFDFVAGIKNIITSGNGIGGTVIDFPNLVIGAVTATDTGDGVINRTTQDTSKNVLSIDSISAYACGLNGFYSTGRAGYAFKSVVIGQITTKNNTQRGIYIDSVGLPEKFAIGHIVTDTGNGIASTVQSAVNVDVGAWQAITYTKMQLRRIKIDVPAIAVAATVTFTLPAGAYWDNILIHVHTADGTNPRLRIKTSSTRADIRLGTAGMRRIGIIANEVNGVDVNTSPMGAEAFNSLGLNAIEAVSAGNVTIYAEQITLN